MLLLSTVDAPEPYGGMLESVNYETMHHSFKKHVKRILQPP